LNLKCDLLVSKFAFKRILFRYNREDAQHDKAMMHKIMMMIKKKFLSDHPHHGDAPAPAPAPEEDEHREYGPHEEATYTDEAGGGVYKLNSAVAP
jgi:hypothetical protein